MNAIPSGAKHVSLKSYKAALVIVTILVLISLTLIDEGTTAFTSELFNKSRLLQRVRGTSKVSEPPRTELIWLMSFPGAGSGDIINTIEGATGLSMGTNYGHKMTKLRKEYLDVFPSEFISEEWYPRGPFKNNVDLPLPTETVLVNTHCTGYCLSGSDDTGRCGRSGYIRTLIPHKRFHLSCYRSRSYDPKRRPPSKGMKPYWMAKVQKVVVIVRNPFDMVVSRYMTDAMNAGKKGTKLGFRAHCAHVNKRWGSMREIRKAKETKLSAIVTDAIPCYPEFFRIFHWYNNAYAIAKKKKSIMVRYEEIEDDIKKSINGILDFAGLEKRENFRGFLEMRSPASSEWWSLDERAAIKLFMHSLGGAQMMDAYFTGYLEKTK